MTDYAIEDQGGRIIQGGFTTAIEAGTWLREFKRKARIVEDK